MLCMAKARKALSQPAPVSRLTRKYQATIPAPVRRFLHLRHGDQIRFHIDGDRVTLTRQTPADRAFLRGLEANLSEWNSPFDDEAYADL